MTAGHVTVPLESCESDESSQFLDTSFLIVEKRTERGDVDAADTLRRFEMKEVEDRKERGLGLSASGGREDDSVLAREHSLMVNS